MHIWHVSAPVSSYFVDYELLITSLQNHQTVASDSEYILRPTCFGVCFALRFPLSFLWQMSKSYVDRKNILVVIKGRRMGNHEMVSPWYESLLTNSRFRVLYFRTIVKRIWCYIEKRASKRLRESIKGTSVFFIRLFGSATFTATLKLVARVG